MNLKSQELKLPRVHSSPNIAKGPFNSKTKGPFNISFWEIAVMLRLVKRREIVDSAHHTNIHCNFKKFALHSKLNFVLLKL